MLEYIDSITKMRGYQGNQLLGKEIINNVKSLVKFCISLFICLSVVCFHNLL